MGQLQPATLAQEHHGKVKQQGATKIRAAAVGGGLAGEEELPAEEQWRHCMSEFSHPVTGFRLGGGPCSAPAQGARIP